FMRQQLLIVTLFFAVTLLLIISIPIENKWSEFSRITEGLSLNLPANILSSYIGHPMIALLLHIILFLITFISFLLLLVFFFLLCILSFNLFFLVFSLLVLPNYIIYFHGVNLFGNTWLPFLIESIVIIFLLLLSTIFDKKIKIKLDINLKYIIYFVLVLLCLF